MFVHTHKTQGATDKEFGHMVREAKYQRGSPDPQTKAACIFSSFSHEVHQMKLSKDKSPSLILW